MNDFITGEQPSGRRSVIERHPRRAQIEHDLAIGMPCRKVAVKYNLKPDACNRHRKFRMPAQLKAEKFAALLKPNTDLEKLRIDESEGLLASLAQQRARLLILQDDSLRDGKVHETALLANQIHKNLELVGKYLGEFASRSVETKISILVSPEYLQLRSALVEVLTAFPEAKRAVAAVIGKIERHAAAGPETRPQPLMIDASPELEREAANA
jgi:hypothetical protein